MGLFKISQQSKMDGDFAIRVCVHPEILIVVDSGNIVMLMELT